MLDNDEKPILITVYMRSNQKNVNESSVTVYPVTANNLKIHEDLNFSGNIEHDIAVLKIPEVIMNENINFAKLLQLSSETYDCENVTGTGWGVINKEGSRPDYAQTHIFQVLESVYCKHFRKEFYDSQMCLYKENSSTCGGDSGAPVYVGNQVVSIAPYISNTEYEGIGLMVYTKVNFFVDWITEKTNIFY